MKKVSKICLLLSICFLAIGSMNAKAKELRLLYWNVQNGMWDGQTDDYKRFTDWVGEQKPDVCVWCEAQKLYITNTADKDRETEEECLNRWKRLAARYGHEYIYLSAHRDNYPQLITSKYPIEMQKKIVGNEDTIVAHGASWSKMKIGKKTINIVTLHTWPQRYGFNIPSEKRSENAEQGGGDKFRRVEMEYICKETILQHKNAKKELWMMMGDFNAISKIDNDHYKLDESTTRYLTHDFIRNQTPYLDLIKETYPNEFIPTTGSRNRIDFVYVTPALHKMVKTANVVWDKYTTPVRNANNISNFWHPSDHLPIIVDFSIK